MVMVFRCHVDEVYWGNPQIKLDCVQTFLGRLEFPLVDALVAADIDLALDELSAVLRMLPKSKAHGGHGFSVEFYQEFSPTLTQGLLDVFLKARDRGGAANPHEGGRHLHAAETGRGHSRPNSVKAAHYDPHRHQASAPHLGNTISCAIRLRSGEPASDATCGLRPPLQLHGPLKHFVSFTDEAQPYCGLPQHHASGTTYLVLCQHPDPSRLG
ncbi:hypothetical protein NDU88_004070 [Pleurodeles waltl]|uniref:Uncharacterized protein n=1 Tax=Pleurodeles waltl TaxID=8319 RepID=A0AAV7T6N7_PLEWA|nr:hypothetical protein NDU88_004070 [Pleurodeles waltl]